MVRTIFLGIGAFCALALGVASPAPAALIGHWPGDGATDELVAGRDGTLINGATYAPGKVGQAFSLDGQNDRVDVLDDPAWTLGGDLFTIALFVNFSSIRADSTGQLPNSFISHDNGSGNTSKWIFFYDAPGGLYLHINGSGSYFLNPATSFTPTVGAWHHVAVTRSGNTFTFYADGNSLGTDSAAVNIPNPSANLSFGQAEGIGHIDGLLDDVRIYDEALGPDAIGRLAALPEPTSVMLMGLAGLAIVRRRA